MKASQTAGVLCLCLAVLVFGRVAHGAGFVSINHCQDYQQSTIGYNFNYTIPLDECTVGLDEGFSWTYWDNSLKTTMKEDNQVELTFYYTETDALKAGTAGGKCEGAEQKHVCTCGQCCEISVFDRHITGSYQINCDNNATEIVPVRAQYYFDATCSNLKGKDTMRVGCNGGRGNDGDDDSTNVAVNDTHVTLTQYSDDTACGGTDTYTVSCAFGECCEHSRGEEVHDHLEDPHILYVKFESIAETENSSTSLTVSLLSMFLVAVFGNIYLF